MKMTERINCPNCDSRNTKKIYETFAVPVNSVLLIYEKKLSLDFPRGNILLKYCSKCSFIFNSTYEPFSSKYSKEYEGTQFFSNTFSQFMLDLADRIVKDLSMHGKKILEIGCGQGEFLELICKRGNNTGIGFDPAYRGKKIKKEIRFEPEMYGSNNTGLDSDLIVCRMTLEHIPETKRFVSMIRKNIDQNDTKVFFQVPNVKKILKDLAFWDIYYEHCSYFNPESLQYLLESSGFKIINHWTDYNDQYLFITAEPTKEIDQFQKTNHNLTVLVDRFQEDINKKINKWKDFFIKNKNKRIMIWGGGSKAVAFITTLKLRNEINLVVDVNPRKDNTFLPGTGHLVVKPEYLKKNPPNIMIIMNPIYQAEIEKKLNRIGINPELVTV